MDQLNKLISSLEENGEHDTSLCHEILATLLKDVIITPGHMDNFVSVIILLSCQQYQSAYNILRWLVYHEQNFFDSMKMSLFHFELQNDISRINWRVYLQRHQDNSLDSFDSIWRTGINIQDDIDWMVPKAHEVPKTPYHWLLVGVPVFIIKVFELRRLQLLRSGFYVFLQGTHPRLGEESHLKVLSGMFPILKTIHKYTIDDDVGRQITQTEDQIITLVNMCRIRALVLDIDVPNQHNPLWTIGFPKDGETIESVLRKENPFIFKLLKYSLQILFKNKDVMVSSQVSNVILKYMNRYRKSDLGGNSGFIHGM